MLKKLTALLLALPLFFANMQFAAAISPFNLKDVPSNDPDYTAIKFLNQHDVIYGYINGNFYPNRNITRAELLKIAIEGAGMGVEAIGYEHHNSTFNDVNTGHSLRVYIIYAVENGFVSGYPDGSFKPNANVTRAEAAKMLANIFSACPGSTVTQYSDIGTSTLKSYIEQLYWLMWYRPAPPFNPSRPILRREVAQIAYRALHANPSECRMHYNPDLTINSTPSDWQFVGSQEIDLDTPPRVSIPAGWYSFSDNNGLQKTIMIGPSEELARGGYGDPVSLISISRITYEPGTEPSINDRIFNNSVIDQSSVEINQVYIDPNRMMDVYEYRFLESGQTSLIMQWTYDGYTIYNARFSEIQMPSQLGVFYRLVQNAVFMNGSFGY